jgi:hypothetical protein
VSSREQWHAKAQALQQLATVDKDAQDLGSFFSLLRRDAALIVGAAMLAEIVLNQTNYAGQLVETCKAAKTFLGTLGLSLADMPTKLRVFFEALEQKGEVEASSAQSRDGKTNAAEKEKQDANKVSSEANQSDSDQVGGFCMFNYE